MPEILPMKVIKFGGTGTQSRIAQTCDRCRSKKIRCDGVRPRCTQCSNVGFECRTSDKLSRRAFPRGYTESLEKCVRALESEVKNLKNLLDEKDEKVEVLSRIHSFSSSHRANSMSNSVLSPSTTKPMASVNSSDWVIRVDRSLIRSEENPFTGLSSTQGFAGIYTDKLVQQGKMPTQASRNSLTALSPPVVCDSRNQTVKTPSRLVSDQLITIFFQEWAPLYPVLHRPTMLKSYEQYLGNTEYLQSDAHTVVQLNLIFGIAALSSTVSNSWSAIIQGLILRALVVEDQPRPRFL
jgi:hypothetical protein